MLPTRTLTHISEPWDGPYFIRARPKIGENLTSLKLSEIGKILPENNLFPSIDQRKSKRILGLEPDCVMITGNKTEDGRLLDRFKPTCDDGRVTMSMERVTFKK